MIILILISSITAFSQGTRLLREPSISATHITFAYGGDIWVADLAGKETLRLTSTPAVEGNPHLSPDGKWIAFNSNRTGNQAVYIVSVDGGTPKRLTWHRAPPRFMDGRPMENVCSTQPPEKMLPQVTIACGLYPWKADLPPRCPGNGPQMDLFRPTARKWSSTG